MFKRLIELQRQGKAVLNPDREAAANPNNYNGTWSPWQVLESDTLVQKALKKIPRPKNQCYNGLKHEHKTSSRSSKKSKIPENEQARSTRTFLDNLVDTFKKSKMGKKLTEDSKTRA